VKKIVSAVALALCVNQAALAAAPVKKPVNPVYNRHHGVYVDINVGTTIYHENVFGDIGGRAGFSWNLNVGYQFIPYFAAEVGITQYLFEGVAAVHGIDVAAKGILPIGDRFALFAKLGVIDYLGPFGISLTAPYVGLGMSYAVTPKLDVTVQAQGGVRSYAQFGNVTAGLSYHFGA